MNPLEDIHIWINLDRNTAQRIAQEVADRLGLPWRLERLTLRRSGTFRHWLATLRWHDIPFVLIPGSRTAVLGYDRSRALRPSELVGPELRYKPSGETVDLTAVPDLDAYLAQFYTDSYLTPLRTVTIAPFLLEVRSLPFPDDPTTHEHITASLHTEFRLPKSDEWEYAAAASRRTLFRWGDRLPTDRYPFPARTTDPHRRSNAFGIIFSPNTYHWEVCAEPHHMRGGDGGASQCGGYGHFCTWLTLAPSFTTLLSHSRIFGAWVRRACTVPV